MALLRSPAVLVMVGQGPLTPQLHALAAQLGVQSRILFMGPLAHAGLVAALHGCDIFTLPSIAPSEAFGLASAEAMACGKPTVVCQLGNGVNVVNQDGVTSLAVPPRDPAALAAALDDLALHPQQRATMGAAARQHIQRRYSLDAMIDATAQLYHEVCDLVPSGDTSH
jgi:rhamnosyl/mannosyltransferase